MAKIEGLQKYLNGIEDYGSVVSPEYKSFQTKYKNYLKALAKEHNGELVKFNPNHYEFSCFIKRNDKYVYISISDVRYFKNQWYSNILIRTAQHEKDYSGGRNCYARLEELGSMIEDMTE